MSQTVADGSTTTFNYTLAGSRITQTDMIAPNSSVTSWRFNPYGYIYEYITADGTTTYTMDSGTNFITGVTDPLNRTISYVYNNYFPFGTFSLYGSVYESNGRVKSITDTLNNTTSYEYEPTLGLQTKITNALSKSTTAAYTFNGKKVTQAVITDPLNHQTTVSYNGYGLPVSVTDANGNASTVVYDTSKHSQVVSVADALGNSMSYTYDASGRVTSIIDAKGAKSSFKYDLADQVIESIDARGNSTVYSYDNNGNLKALTDVKGNTTKYQYDGMNRLIKTTDRMGRSEFYAYYAGSEITPATGTNLKSFTDKRGKVTTFDSYDAMDRLLHVTFSDASTIQFTYDTVGRPTAIIDSLYGTISYAYDALDRVVSETTPSGTITYAYDAIGRRTSMTLAGEPVVSYGYDDASRPVSISKMVGGILRNYALGYDNGGRRTSLQVPLLAVGDKINSSYGFDAGDRLQSITHQSPMGILESMSYISDPNGNRSSMSRGVTLPTVIAMSGTSYNAEYEMLSYNGNTLTYDENGNLTSKTDSAGNVTTYTWDARNQLVAISAPTTTPPLSATFQYDVLGRRVSKTVNGTTTMYVYDGVDIIQEITNGVKTNYVRTLGIDEPLSKVDDNGIVRHYIRDGLGSIVGLVDDAGNQVSQIAYNAYGMTGSVESFGFTSREKDDGTALMYYRARYYSPEMMRFISRDPLGFGAGDANFYGYVGQNPGNFIDPLGLANINLYNPKGTRSENFLYKQTEMLKLDKYYTISGHGNKDFMQGPNSNRIDVDDLAKMIRNDPNYKGQTIYLSSCSTGKGNNSFAQRLANKLNTSVIAPNDDIKVHVSNENGYESFNETIINNGKFIYFIPKKP